MQVQNSNSQQQSVLSKIAAISQDVITHYKSNREYKLQQRLTEEYTYVYNQCNSKPNRSQNIFGKYKQVMTLHFLKSSKIQDGSNIFNQTNKIWNGYIKFATIISKHIFSYLDRYFLPGRQHGNLIDVSASIFDKLLFGHKTNKNMYLQKFILEIRKMRQNMVITQNYLYQFVKQLYLINTELYFQFKKIYIEETTLFYINKFNQFKNLDPIYYYHAINNLIYFQDAICSFCLYWTKEETLKQRVMLPIIFTKQLIEPYTNILITHPRGLINALKTFDLPLLNIVSDIYSRFQGFQKIKKHYYDYIAQESKIIVNALEKISDIPTVIHYISQFFNKHQVLLTSGFKKHQQMYVTLSNALQFCIGKWQKLQQTLFHFCKKTVSQKTFDKYELIIRSIFQKISSKDEFIHKCQLWMQSVILSQQLQLQEENKFVNFIHALCGTQNTLKLTKLFHDYLQSNQSRHQNSTLTCKIIFHHLWERRFKEQIAVCLTLPSPLQASWQSYLQAFQVENSKKKLRLLPLTSKLTLQITFNGNNRLKVICNLLQASIILSIYESPKSEDDLISHINTQKHLITSYLTTAKFITLLGQKLNIDWNSLEEGEKDYTEQFEEKSRFIKAIEQDRNILLEAGIVRMIKRRKQASFQECFNYLCETIKLFRPQPHMVKTTLQKLIKRDFIQANQQGLYLYKQ